MAQPEITPEVTPVIETVTETPIFVPTTELTIEPTSEPTETILFPDLPTEFPLTEEPTLTTEPLPFPTELPAGFQLLSPAHKSTVTDENITFSWTEVPGARWYRIHLYRNNGEELFKRRFKNPAVICANGVCSVTLSANEIDLRNARRYKWLIVTRTAHGKNLPSVKNSFRTSLVITEFEISYTNLGDNQSKSPNFQYYYYNFDTPATPANMTVEVLNYHVQDHIPDDGQPGTTYEIGNKIYYYDSVGNRLVYIYESNKAIGGYSKYPPFVSDLSYPVTLEVKFTLPSPSRFIDYNSIAYGMFTRNSTNLPPFRLKLKLYSDQNKLLEGVICESPCEEASFNHFLPVANVTHVHFVFETFSWEANARAYYHTLDNIGFTVDVENTIFLDDYNVYLLGATQDQTTAVKIGVNNTARALTRLLPDDPNESADGYRRFRKVFFNEYALTISNSPQAHTIAFVFVNKTGACKTENWGETLHHFYSSPNLEAWQLEARQLLVNGPHKDRIHQSVVICNKNIPFTQYVTVHELGHVFDRWGTRYSSGGLTKMVEDTQFGETTSKYTFPVNQFHITDLPISCTQVQQYLTPNYCQTNFNSKAEGRSYLVMGMANDPILGMYWTRGDRGWGSGPGVLMDGKLNYSDFQQNPENTPTETAADMFLNWVYREIELGAVSEVMGYPMALVPGDGIWHGFLEKSWLKNDPRWGVCNTPLGCSDYSTPGNERFKWTRNAIAYFVSLYQ